MVSIDNTKLLTSIEGVDYGQYVEMRQAVIWGGMRVISSSTAMASGSPVSLLKAVSFYSYFPSLHVGPLATYEVFQKGVKMSLSSHCLTENIL